MEVAAEKSGWGKPLSGAEGRGIATYYTDEAYLAAVAEVSVDRRTGVIDIHRIVCAVDGGPIINPDIAEAQIAGALVMGLSAALKEKWSLPTGASNRPILPITIRCV